MKKESGSVKYDHMAAVTRVEQLRTAGEIQIRLAAIKLRGVIGCILAGGGIVASVLSPESSKDTWLIIGPVVAALVSGAAIGPVTCWNAKSRSSKKFD